MNRRSPRRGLADFQTAACRTKQAPSDIVFAEGTRSRLLANGRDPRPGIVGKKQSGNNSNLRLACPRVRLCSRGISLVAVPRTMSSGSRGASREARLIGRDRTISPPRLQRIVPCSLHFAILAAAVAFPPEEMRRCNCLSLMPDVRLCCL